MSKIKLKIVSPALEEVLKGESWLRDIFSVSLKEIMLKMQAEAKKKAKVDTGEMRKRIEMEYVDDLHILVEARAEHSAPVEFGRVPGIMPPVNVFEKWAKRHGFENPASAKWAIAMSIKKRGIPPSPFMGPAFDDVSEEAADILKKNFERIKPPMDR